MSLYFILSITRSHWKALCFHNDSRVEGQEWKWENESLGPQTGSSRLTGALAGHAAHWPLLKSRIGICTPARFPSASFVHCSLRITELENQGSLIWAVAVEMGRECLSHRHSELVLWLKAGVTRMMIETCRDIRCRRGTLVFGFRDVFRQKSSTLESSHKTMSFLSFLKDFINLFLERKGGRKRGRETSMCGCLSGTPYRGPGRQPRHMPWQGIELATLWFTACTQSTEPHQPGPLFYFLYCL